jgi:hypothetical protein
MQTQFEHANKQSIEPLFSDLWEISHLLEPLVTNLIQGIYLTIAAGGG